MEARIALLQEKKLLGRRLRMSFSANTTRDLWKGFMQQRHEIRNAVGSEMYSMQIYPPAFFSRFDMNAEFEKWATVEVENFDTVPEGMEPFILQGGLYAVFLYRGMASAAGPTFQYILGTWIPASEYVLDNRPHFEILGAKYKNDDPDSEEEIWIPIKPKEKSI